VEANLALFLAPAKSHREIAAELATCRLVANAAIQAGTQDVQFGLAHGALQPEHEAIVEGAWIIDPVLVGKDRGGQPAQVEQTIPIGVVAGQAGHLQPKDDADATQSDLGGELGETGAVSDAASGQAEVLVDDKHLVLGPAQLQGSGDELVLARGGFAVALQLGGAGLADIDHRHPLAMDSRDLGVLHHEASSWHTATPQGRRRRGEIVK